jgi:hypothetical protein
MGSMMLTLLPGFAGSKITHHGWLYDLKSSSCGDGEAE